MSSSPDDHLFSEEFELSDELDSSSLSALFSSQSPAEPAKEQAAPRPRDADRVDLGGEDELIELDDDEDERPEPVFGSLADDERPVLGDTNVFSRLRGDDVAPEPDPFAGIGSAQTPGADVKLDEPSAADAFAKLSWREKLAAARKLDATNAAAKNSDEDLAELSDEQDDPRPAPAVLAASDDDALPPPPLAPRAAPAAEPDEEDGPRRMSLRERIAFARAQVTGGEGPEDDADDDDVIDLDDDTSLSAIDEDAGEPGVASAGGLRGFLAKRKALLAQATDAPQPSAPRKARRRGPAAAGVDASAPSLAQKLRDRTRKPIAKASPQERASRFGELLTPLSPSDLGALQRDVAADTPLFERVEATRRSAQSQANWGFLVGLLTTAMFGWSVGKDYLTELLPNAAQPSWLYDVCLTATNNNPDTAADLAGGVLFGLGLLLPLLATMVVAQAVRFVWRGLQDRRIDDVLLGALAILCAGITYKSLQSAEIAVAALGLGAWVFCRSLVRVLTRLVNRGER